MDVFTAAIPSLRNFDVFRVLSMPFEERRKPIHESLTAARILRMAGIKVPSVGALGNVGQKKAPAFSAFISYL